MTAHPRRSGPVTTRAASTSTSVNATAGTTVPCDLAAMETLRALVDGLRMGAARSPQPLGCLCGCASRSGAPDPACARFIRDHGAEYRRKVALRRAAEGRAA